MLTTSSWSVERRLSTYFLVMYGAMGLTGPFFAPWLRFLEIDATTTGLIVALPSLGMVLSSVYIGSVADKLPDWRTAIMASDWIVLLLLSWMLFRQQVVDIIVVWTLAGLLIAAKTPILDAATISLARRRGLQYARFRALGSLGFVIALMLAGQVFNLAGLQWFVPVLIFGAFLRAVLSASLPHFRESTANLRLDVEEKLAAPAVNLGAAAGNITSAPATLVSPDLQRGLLHPGFLLVIVGSAMISASHAFWGAFGMVHWLERDIGTFTSSVLWGTAVVAEVIFMWRFTGIADRFSARYSMVVAGLVGIVRWTLMTTEPELHWLFLLQVMHAFSFALLFMATVNFIARRVDDSNAARAQALSATIVTGVLALATMVSGSLYDRVGVQGYWLMCLMCVVGIILLLASYATQLVEQANA